MQPKLQVTDFTGEDELDRPVTITSEFNEDWEVSLFLDRLLSMHPCAKINNANSDINPGLWEPDITLF